MFFSLYFLLY